MFATPTRIVRHLLLFKLHLNLKNIETVFIKNRSRVDGTALADSFQAFKVETVNVHLTAHLDSRI